MYGNQQEVGAGLGASGIGCGEVFVTTKVWRTDIARDQLERSAEDSLRRLGIAELDLLLIHWPNPDVPLDESIGALNACRSRGPTRHIGVSNFPTAVLQWAIAASEAPPAFFWRSSRNTPRHSRP